MTTTDHDGKFRIRARGRGELAVMDGADAIATVPLMGHRRYNLGEIRIGGCGD